MPIKTHNTFSDSVSMLFAEWDTTFGSLKVPARVLDDLPTSRAFCFDTDQKQRVRQINSLLRGLLERTGTGSPWPGWVLRQCRCGSLRETGWQLRREEDLPGAPPPPPIQVHDPSLIPIVAALLEAASQHRGRFDAWVSLTWMVNHPLGCRLFPSERQGGYQSRTRVHCLRDLLDTMAAAGSPALDGWTIERRTDARGRTFLRVTPRQAVAGSGPEVDPDR